MILADKIITLRKKAGWSQEELASQLGVTRQSVSKWEGAQSVPDLDKVVQMSRLFGVSTDYLLKDELEEEEFVESEADEAPLRRVTMEQAARYLALRKACAPKLALAVAMCIVSRDHFSLRHGGRGPGLEFGGSGRRSRRERHFGAGRHCGGDVPLVWGEDEGIRLS